MYVVFCKPVPLVRTVNRGQRLRIMSPAAFRLRWTPDEWQTVNDIEATRSGVGISFVDIPIGLAQQSPIRFTFYWLETMSYPFFHSERGQWEGRDFTVHVLA